MSVAVGRATNIKDLATRAKGFEIPAEIVDGMDVLAVKEAVERASAKCRAGEGPMMLECKTYRYFGHSRSDPRAYRTKEEEKFWKDRDPLLVFSKYLKENEIATNEELKTVEEQAAKDIEEAVQFAIDSPYPEVEDVLEDLFA
jgi:TPP-dependent pyruvate/acetoin dehydrogenase alpha subunit